ncbi:putative RumB/ImpB like DNA repair protein [Mariprofundus ferrooxydans PV-1]|uniref:Putative RumB/ImpB like DNA repair protein n=2 Tax=Mariprofundus ferrooxydans TaxID=314344 RepID=Q0EWQ8_9PROT|nr:putative RumB/ImpB like DNA repair protein [Mariprofundus ferrooxydans PV-1]
MMSNWPNAIAHVDADCFYASCELVRRPELRGKPLCVLSSQDACIVAKTYDAKAAGIKTGMPVWEAKKLMPHASYLSADFRFYGLLSEKMFSILSRFSPDIEVYSIDEGFLDLNGTQALWKKDYQGIAHDIRRTVHREVGITVSVGISVTRILAKMASEYNKPNGVAIVPQHMIKMFLERSELSDICGIGRNRLATLNKFNIQTPVDFVNTDVSIIKRLLGKSGTDLWHELQGISIMGLETHPQLPKSISRTASMGEVTSDRQTIAAHLTRHAFRLATELVLKKYLTKRITVFLKQKDFNAVSAKADFSYPTNNYFQLSRAVRNMLNDLYQTGELYRACGITAQQITRSEDAVPDLFGKVKRDEKQADLFLTVDRINKRYGAGAVKMAGAFDKTGLGGRVRFMYPLLVAR